MTEIDHRAEAEKHLYHAACAAGVGPRFPARHLKYALTHAALYQEELIELRAAVRTANLHQRGGSPEGLVILRREQWDAVVALAYDK